MIVAVLILGLLILMLANRIILNKSYKLFNPVSLILYVWIFAFIFHAILFGINEHTYITYMFIFIGILWFVLGFWYMKDVCIQRISYNKLYNLEYMEKVVAIFTFLEIIRLIYLFCSIMKIAGSFSTFINSNTYVRYMYLQRVSNIYKSIFEFFIGATCMLGVPIVGTYWAKKGKRRNRYLILWIAIELFSALITMSKMSFILSIIVLLISIMNNIGDINVQRRFIIKRLPGVGICMLGFLIIIGIQRNYTQVLGGSLLQIVIKKAGVYFTGGIEALSEYITRYGSRLDMGKNSFMSIHRIIARLGIVGNDSVLQHASAIELQGGISTNIYTWFIDFYKDYSYAGFIIMSLLLGGLVGCIYTPQKHNLFLDIAIPWISAVIVMSFYALLWKQTIYIFIIFYAYIIHFILSKKIYFVAYDISKKEGKNGKG